MVNGKGHRPARAWYEIRDDLPDGHLLMTVLTPQGTMIAVRRGHISGEMVEELNRMLEHVVGTGLWQPGADDQPDESNGPQT
ncbi:hypothetical protein [Streptomyces sp. NPDC088785]|uniref:hypothetical protein n=1 Tax=Streptomyces sp. NPDC088785 TaxID=3365897 RepID=UPI00381D96BE